MAPFDIAAPFSCPRRGNPVDAVVCKRRTGRHRGEWGDASSISLDLGPPTGTVQWAAGSRREPLRLDPEIAKRRVQRGLLVSAGATLSHDESASNGITSRREDLLLRAGNDDAARPNTALEDPLLRAGDVDNRG